MACPPLTDPASRLCRGCAGTGLDHALSPREFQIATKEFYAHKGSDFNGVKSNQVASLLVCAPVHAERKRLHGEGPLTYILAMIEHYRSIGFEEFDTSPEWLATLACTWCHGTGVASLSVATMRAVAS